MDDPTPPARRKNGYAGNIYLCFYTNRREQGRCSKCAARESSTCQYGPSMGEGFQVIHYSVPSSAPLDRRNVFPKTVFVLPLHSTELSRKGSSFRREADRI